MKEIPPGCASSGCLTTLIGGLSEPFGVTLDGSGVDVTSVAGKAVDEVNLSNPPSLRSARAALPSVHLCASTAIGRLELCFFAAFSPGPQVKPATLVQGPPNRGGPVPEVDPAFAQN